MQVRVNKLEQTHGLRSLSSRMSYPYNSKQCLSLMMTFCTLCKLRIKMLSMSLKRASTATLPCFAVKYRRNCCICHLQPCKETKLDLLLLFIVSLVIFDSLLYQKRQHKYRLFKSLKLFELKLN